MYSVEFTKDALRLFRKLDKPTQVLTITALERLKLDPKIGDPLKASLKGFWRFRFRNYRIVYEIKEKKLIIIVFAIGHRKEIYKKLQF